MNKKIERPKKVTVGISITKEQFDWCRKKGVNISGFVRTKLMHEMKALQ